LISSFISRQSATIRALGAVGCRSEIAPRDALPKPGRGSQGKKIAPRGLQSTGASADTYLSREQVPTVTSYLNGMSAGMGGGNPNPSKRGTVNGWSAAAVRRHTAWLYSVNGPELDGRGFAATLTMRDIPESSEAFHRAVQLLLLRLKRWGAVRVHWVVEWTARKRPHLHLAIYFPVDWECAHDLVATERIVGSWLAVASDWGAARPGQHVKPIVGALGWLQYLSKHAARGAAHYQRQGKPAGWEKTGRLWGHTGEWPADPPMRFGISTAAYWRYRRLIRSWRVADARQALLDARDGAQRKAARRRISQARRMLSCSQPKLSAVRGVSEWAGETPVGKFLELLAGEGHVLIQK